MTRRTKLMTGVATVCVLFILCTWIWADALAERLLSAGLRAAGLEAVSLSVTSLNRQELVLESITFSYPAGAGMINVTGNDVIAEYSLQSLRTGHGISLFSKQLDLELVTDGGKPGAPILARMLEVIPLLGRDLTSVIPFRTIQFPDWRVSQRGGENLLSGTVALEHTETGMRIDANLEFPSVTPHSVNLENPARGQWSLLVREDSSDQKLLDVHVSSSAAELSVAGELNLGLVPNTLVNSDIIGVVKFEIIAPQTFITDGSVQAKIALTTDEIDVDGIRAEQMAVSVDGSWSLTDTGGINLDNGQTLVSLEVIDIAGETINGLDFSSNLRLFAGPDPSVRMPAGSTLHADSMSSAFLSAEGIDLSFGALLQASATGSTHISLDGGTQAHVKSLRLQDTEWPLGLDLTLLERTGFLLEPGSFTLESPAHLSSPGFLLESNDITLVPRDTTIRLDTLQIGKGAIDAEGQLQSESLTISAWENELTLAAMDQAFLLSERVLSVQGQAQDTLRNLALTTSLQHQYEDGRGDLVASTGPLLLSPATPLSRHIVPFEVPIDIVAGSLQARVDTSWDRGEQGYSVTLTLDIDADDLGGAWGNLFFSGLSTEFSTQLFPALQTTENQELLVQSIDIGIPLTTLVASYGLAPSPHGALAVLELPYAEANFLGGKITLEENQYDPNLDANELNIGLSGIPLSRVVELQQLRDIEATGVLDGKLPVTISDAGISVNSGNIRARNPGGKIVYSADTSVIENAAPGSDIVFNALKNFNYTSLQIEPDYDSSGLLVLGLQLQGRNPDLEGGRQINLNINLEQNVLKLLQSLRFVDGLNQAIDSRVQQFYQRSKAP